VLAGCTVEFMPNLSLVRLKELSSFRKIALGTWQTAYDPSIYGTLLLRMDRALDYIARFGCAPVVGSPSAI